MAAIRRRLTKPPIRYAPGRAQVRYDPWAGICVSSWKHAL
jgi:hypothetical protein